MVCSIAQRAKSLKPRTGCQTSGSSATASNSALVPSGRKSKPSRLTSDSKLGFVSTITSWLRWASSSAIPNIGWTSPELPIAIKIIRAMAAFPFLERVAQDAITACVSANCAAEIKMHDSHRLHSRLISSASSIGANPNSETTSSSRRLKRKRFACSRAASN